MEPFQVRLNCVDHYQAAPSEFDPPLPYRDGAVGKYDRPKVPVIRIFGATETGQKVCVHVHGAFPYLYVQYDGSLAPQDVRSAIKNLHTSIDHALATSYRRNAYDKYAVYVAHITIVKGVPFYGYHVGYQFFFKIYLLSPLYTTRLAGLLLQGAVLKRSLQPYESHLQYIPQWMCDYSLYGCAYMKCSKVKFRHPVPEYLDLTHLSHHWHDRSIQADSISDETSLPKQSHCPLEVDICVHDILNRSEISERLIHHDFTEFRKPMSMDERLVPSMVGLWQDETRRRKKRLGLDDPGSSPFGPEDLTSLSADPRNHTKGSWIHEEEFFQMVSQIAAEERKQPGVADVTVDNFLPENPFTKDIKTSLESVEDFHTYEKEFPHLPANQLQTTDGSVLAAWSEGMESDDGPYPSDDEEVVDLFAEEGSDGGYADDIEESANVDDEIALIDVPFHGNDPAALLDEGENPSNRLGYLNSPENIRIGIQKAKRTLESPKHTDNPYPSKKRWYAEDENLRSRDMMSDAWHPPGAVGIPSKDTKPEQRLNPEPSSQARFPPSQSNIHPIAGSQKQNSRLNFPVVKDPNDPFTIFNYSQEANPSKFMHQSPETKELPRSLNTPKLLVGTEPSSYSQSSFETSLSASNPFLSELAPLIKGRSFLPGERIAVLRDKQEQERNDQRRRELCTSRTWEFAPVPPSRSEVVEWFESQNLTETNQVTQPTKSTQKLETKPNILSQIEGPTQKNEYGFKYSQKTKTAGAEQQTQYMSFMSLEVHVNTRGVLSPNPEEDEIACVFWCIQSDDVDLDANSNIPGTQVGMIFQGEGNRPEEKVSRALKITLEHEPTELDLMNRLIDLVRFHDPDIITGYEVHNGSWGYVIERARKKYDFDLCDQLSRVKSQSHGRFGKDADRWGFTHTSSIRVTGRHMINIWRAMSSELNLLQYTMENVVFHLLHRRIPHYSFRDLTEWYQSSKPRDILKVIDYFVSRVQMDLEILETNELVPRISEQARLLGVDFYSVFSRGSQFKVESLMFRIAKPENFLLVSPSRKQVAQQNALECLPLVMEPQSDFYTSPVLVLDFQSLYPSIMIAYNYCYSTFLGRARQWRGRDKMGFTDYQRQLGLLELFKDKINIAPNGMIYAKQEVRKSLLAKMLSEILETRVMVKTGMKMDKDDKGLQRLLNNRQLALKLIANVTYGYASASFSGRMPCSEIADSIVQSGRETLEKAIALIHSVDRWGAEVVYGDTDSLFVHLKGRSRDEAFDIGQEIAKAVTEINPHPVKLKFEKVYHPCVLLAKKRYVGFKYEHRDQKEPEFDAKGIETVRRDGTPAEQKIEEKALKLLFRTADLSQVKRYFQNQCTKILQGKVSIQDFCFAREVRLGTYSERGLPPPGALISTKKMLEDPRAEPQYGERVPYVVVTGAPGSRLIDRCVPPETLLNDAQIDLDAEYYITKNLIPPLERIFNLVGANVRQWYDEMPKFQRIRRVEGTIASAGKDTRKTLESYMKASSCIICKTKLTDTDVPVCVGCMQQSHVSLLDLVTRRRQAENRVSDLHQVCRSCMGVPFGDDVKCDSKDCPVFYSRTRHMANWKHTKAVLDPVIKLLQDVSENELEW
ncbi:DNA polymerase zeta [Aspergillus nanangensis]|uniref:DNA polymerase n=1 Tax=Aspergillus nanangensis TaxID=2582783 RepID=A0AAD4CNH6_ASPNN|nr:DNA polymerase zeta [Aspergillus nanangensis]